MSLQGVSTGLKALIAAQSSLDTIGNNLANINTPGYSRQRVELVQALGLERNGVRIGTGVDALTITRAIDHLLESRILGQLGVRAQLAERYAAAQEIEFALGEFDGTGVGQSMDSFFAAAKQLTGDPADGILRSNLVQGGIQLGQRFNQVYDQLQAVGGSVKDALRTSVAEANALAQQIAELNRQIRTLEPGGDPANQLRDQRQVAVQALANLSQVEVREDRDGTYRVYVEGNLVVAADRSMRLTTSEQAGGALAVQLEGSAYDLSPKSGRIAALLALQDQDISDLTGGLDQLAKGLIHAVNSAHSTGIPSGGGFTSLVGSNPLQDLDGNGQLSDQLLADSGLPFDLLQGELTVNVLDEQSGEQWSQQIAIDPATTTVGEFLAALGSVPGIGASLNAENQLSIVAEAGLRFDFSNRLDPDPDGAGTLSGGKAKLGSASKGPYNLPAGSGLDFAVPAGGPANVSVAFPLGSFPDATEVSAEQLAEFLNNDAGFSGAGLEAHAVGGFLQLTSAGAGSSQSFSLTGGGAAAALGLSGKVGQTAQGSDDAAAISVSGALTGAVDKQLVFAVTGDGTVGTTPGLGLQVFDSTGALVATLDIGAGYQPGTPLAVIDGIEVAVSLGELSGSSDGRFAIEARADSDSADVLVALGLNGFFVGSDAQTIAVRSDLAADPDLIAASWTGTSGGNQALLALGQIETQELALLDGRTLGSRYDEMIGGLGFDLATMELSLDTADQVLASLQQRRDSVSGVNADEELVDLTRFQQAYATAAQYLSVVTRLQDELLSIL
jgi:flagellar hook-associated protein FlgK